MAENEAPEQEASESSGGKKKLIIIIVAALLLVGLAVGGVLMFLGGNDESQDVVVEDPGPSKGDPQYFDLKPFTVNLSADDEVAFLQVQIQALTYYEEVFEQLEKHRPLIRNNLTLLFAQQKSIDLRSPEGKEALQKKVLETIQSVISKYGNGGEVDNVFFTSFVMQ